MKKKILIRSVGVMFSEEMYSQIKKLTDQAEIGVSDFIRNAVQQVLSKNTVQGGREYENPKQ